MSLNQSKTIDLQILRKIDSFKSFEYAATDTPASIEGGIENENILIQCNDKIRTARSFASNIFFVFIIGHKLFHVFSIVRMQQRSQISGGVTNVSALQGEFLMMTLHIATHPHKLYRRSTDYTCWRCHT